MKIFSGLLILLFFNVGVSAQCTVIINNPGTVCTNSTVDITLPAITAGSTAALSYTYWNDSLATIKVANPNIIINSGTYYIKGTEISSGCYEIKPVTVSISNYWTGAASNEWENPANWSCGRLPDAGTRVIINSGTVTVNSNVVIQSIVTNPSVVLTVLGTNRMIVGAASVSHGVQKQIFGSTRHNYDGIFEANNNRVFFGVYNTDVSKHELYCSNRDESSYKLDVYGDEYNWGAPYIRAKLKPNGDVIGIMRERISASNDTIIILLNRDGAKSWQVLKKEAFNAFWANYYSADYSTSLYLFVTASGRLVLTGRYKIAVSDDDGITWRETFSRPAGMHNTDNYYVSTIGNRNFILSDMAVLYSDDNFETGTMTTMTPYGGFIENKLIQLDDGRLVLNYYNALRQSSNNGQSWTNLPFPVLYDSISEMSDSYFGFVSGTTMRMRGKYKPCSGFFTIDIDPSAPFSFYPSTFRPNCAYVYPSYDQLIKSSQTEDKRIYFIAKWSSTFSELAVYRDY